MVPRDGRPRQPARFQPRLAGRQVAQAAAAGHARSRCLAGRVPPPVADEAHVSDIRLQRPGGVWRERGRSRYHPTPFRVAVSSPSTGTGLSPIHLTPTFIGRDHTATGAVAGSDPELRRGS